MISTKIAPRNILTLSAIVVAGIIACAVYLALQAPMLGMQFTANGEGGVQIGSVAAHSPNHGGINPGVHIVAFLDADGQPVPLDADLLIEEPDQLDQWTRYNDFMARQTRLAQAAASSMLVAMLDSGQRVELKTYPRTLTDLPGLFWVQILVGLLACSIAAGVWAFRLKDRAAIFYMLAGVGLMLSAIAAAVYSSRELIMDGTLVRPLSLVNHLGALFFTASLFSLLWNYPRRLARFPMEIVVFAAMLLAWFSDLFEFAPDLAWASNIPVLLLFAPTFLLAFLQWRHTRGRPVERAALKWYLLSIFIGTGLFAGAILIPVSLGIPPVASQGMMFVVFLFMFVGIALGIVRYRLFDLDRWWFTTWLWLLGGVLVILFDFALVALLHISETTAIAVSLALAGWLYFPLRQWLLIRLLPRRSHNSSPLPDDLLQLLFAAPDKETLYKHWRHALRQIYLPLEFTVLAAPLQQPGLAEHGQTLELPCLDGAHGLRLRFPEQGTRLFSHADCQRADAMLALGHRLCAALDARQQGMREERQRIIRDVHDDLGAKLLSMIYTAENPAQEELARSASRDMRDILSALEGELLPLGEVLALMQQELRQRAGELGVAIDLEGPFDCGQPVSARVRTNLSRIVREAVSNAARHGRARVIKIHFDARDGLLEFSVCDDGPGDPATWTAGRGTRSIHQRIGELGGQADWRREGPSCCLLGSLPLKAAGVPAQEKE